MNKIERRYVSELAICRLIKNHQCCPSCHTDDEEGYRSLEEIELGKGRIACVCCAVRLNYNLWKREEILDVNVDDWNKYMKSGRVKNDC